MSWDILSKGTFVTINFEMGNFDPIPVISVSF